MFEAELNRILYVEDDPDIRTVATIALEVVGGFTVMTCKSGMEALAEAGAFLPDLLLLDVMMPEMDGPTTLACLRELAPIATTPVIFMTAKVHDTDIDFYKSLGAIGVIAKPFDPMQLAQQIGRLWQHRASLPPC